MQNNNFKVSAGGYFGIIFFLLLFVAIFMKDIIFDLIIQSTGGNQIQESQAATQETTKLLLSLDKIQLDTSVFNSTYLQSLTPLPTYPTDAQTLSNFGKTNPFLGGFQVVPGKATSSVGAIIYSNQRGANDGNSVTSVSSTRR